MIDLEHVSYRYGAREAPALADVSLHVADEEIVGVLGVNGSGKTTLLRACSGLMRPGAGTVRVNGAVRAGEIRSSVAFAPDEGEVYPFLSITEAGEFLGHALATWDAGRWTQLLTLLELPGERRPQELSKGQRARLRLAQTLAQRAPVLLLDEPLAGIDLRSRERIAESLAADLAGTPRTVLMATHEIAEVEGLFGRVVIMEQGQVAVDAAADELRAASGGSIEAYVRRGEWR